MEPIWFPIASAVWLVIAIFTIYHNWGYWRDEVLGFWTELLFGIFFGVVGLGACALVLFGLAYGVSVEIGDHAAQSWERGWHGDLASLRNADGIQGSVVGTMFLMSGHLGSREVYYYYVKEGPDVYRPHSWFVDKNVYIIEQDRQDGEVWQSHRVFVDKRMNKYGIIRDSCCRMDFYIPRGSLVHQYNLK